MTWPAGGRHVAPYVRPRLGWQGESLKNCRIHGEKLARWIGGPDRGNLFSHKMRTALPTPDTARTFARSKGYVTLIGTVMVFTTVPEVALMVRDAAPTFAEAAAERVKVVEPLPGAGSAAG